MSCMETLHELGYRMTPQRLLILEAIHSHEDHFSAEEIYSQVQARLPRVNISTVYRTLELLEEQGLVAKADLGGEEIRYHPAEKGHHHHLICRKCKRIIDLDEATLTSFEETLLRDYQFIADLRHLTLFGRCVNCR